MAQLGYNRDAMAKVAKININNEQWADIVYCKHLLVQDVPSRPKSSPVHNSDGWFLGHMD